MKNIEIKSIIESTVASEIKKRILMEQDASTEVTNKLKSLPSLSVFSDKITNYRDIGGANNFGIMFDISNITEDEFVSSLNADTFENAQRILNSRIHGDLDKSGMAEKCDIEIGVMDENGSLTINVKIVPNNNEINNELTESKDMKNKKSKEFLNALHKAKKSGKKSFVMGNEKYDVDECYKEIKEQEEAENCLECDEEVHEYVIDGEEGNDIDEPSEPEEPTNPENVDDLGEPISYRPHHRSYTGGKFDEEDAEQLFENKKVLRLTESELVAMIKRIVTEAVPGIEVTKKAQDGSKRENDEYQNSVDKKMKDYLSFEGNDNPEFPKSIGKGDKVAYENTTDDEEYIEDNRGGKPSDLVYDTPKTKERKEREKKYLEGSSETGNAIDKTVNVVKDDVGKKIGAAAERKAKNKKTDPMYKKDPQPIETVSAEAKTIQEEILKMRRLANYNETTQ